MQQGGQPSSTSLRLCAHQYVVAAAGRTFAGSAGPRQPGAKKRRAKVKSVPTARRAAVEQLLRVEEGFQWDARLVTELVSGCVRWQRRLDFVIESLTGAPVTRLDPPLRQLLRLATYELLELGVPHHVISEHVSLAKQLMHPGAGAFANGVLRNLARLMAEDAVPRPAHPTSATLTLQQRADLIGIAHSHPSWMVQRWLERFGEQETLDLLRWNNMRPAGHGVRVAPAVVDDALLHRLAAEGVTAEPSRFLPRDFVVVRRGLQHLLAKGLLAARGFQVQDESAGLVVELLDPQPGDVLLDCCAAPGGKALYALQRLAGQGLLLAMDVHAGKLRRLETAAVEQGRAGQLEVHTADLRDHVNALMAGPPAGPGLQSCDAFDKVLLDVPCSGLGVLSKRADLRWRRSPADLAGLRLLQAELLEAAAQLVRPGGLLVYSTCSIEPQENEDQGIGMEPL
ncbi:hypothetical protein WJX72_009483 [[Myrmecia] bisecta]|uniref:SAM-dependent MTase RsmB/NOP-type domain-containing protein n=1 Tax=[Myrmecia] bisecta TaxID=41462 RepID=A0AAW1P712_9CHLO